LFVIRVLFFIFIGIERDGFRLPVDRRGVYFCLQLVEAAQCSEPLCFVLRRLALIIARDCSCFLSARRRRAFALRPAAKLSRLRGVRISLFSRARYFILSGL